MTAETHHQMADFIWDICNLLRGPYRRNEYRKVILPLTVLRRFDCILEPTKERAMEEYNTVQEKPESIVRAKMEQATGVKFYNLSKLDFKKLLDDANQIAPNLNSYINNFSENIREIFDRFEFEDEIRKMSEKNILYQVVKKFSTIDLSPDRIDSLQMGYIFEELIRIGAEQSNEEAGEHFTPREIIKLMVDLVLSPEDDLAQSFKVKTVYDPACGTGGMLSEAEQYIKQLNEDAQPYLFGQDWNDEAWAICRSDMLIKGHDEEKIRLGDSFSEDAYPDEKFDYMLANPPFGVSWKQGEKFIKRESETLGYNVNSDNQNVYIPNVAVYGIIEILNNKFGAGFSEEDGLFFEQIREKAVRNEKVIQTAEANPPDKFQLGIKKLIEDLMIQRMSENDDMVSRYMEDVEFQNAVYGALAEEIYEQIVKKFLKN